MRAQKQQQQKQQLGGTLKAFVRVGKATDAPAGKSATAVRMTRSKSAAAAAVLKPAIETTEVVTEHTVVKETVKADVVVAGGKRKLAEVAETPEPAPAPAPKKRVAGRRKTTTIDAYFAPMEDVVAEPVATEPAVASTEAEVTEKTPEPAAEEAATQQQAETEKEKPASRDARATALLGRLRARHVSGPKAADSAAAGSSLCDTREIKEALRMRRQPDTAPVAVPSPATFTAARVASETALHQREQRRQFVVINRSPRALPRNLSKLSTLFQALEHTLLFAPQHNVQKGVVYHRVRKSVEVMARWTFGWRELGQIVAVYPEAYVCERADAVHDGRSVVSVTIRPTVKAGVQMAVEMEHRRLEFQGRLDRLVDTAYGAFLVRRGWTREEVEKVQGAAWHPEFDIEETPAVVPVVMPPPAQQKPAFDRERLRHLLGKAEAKAEAPKSKDEAEAPVSKPAALPTPTDSPLLTAHTAETPQPPPAAKSASGSSAAAALLARIRAKQQAKSPATLGRATQSMHSRLPGVVEAVSFMFYAERKSSLPFALVAEKIAESRGLDLKEAAGHLLALARLVPEWCAVLDEKGEKLEDPGEAPQGARLRITRAISMQEAKTRLAAKLQSGDAVE